jgi:hypothetical protein
MDADAHVKRNPNARSFSGIALSAVKHSCHASRVVEFYTSPLPGLTFSALHKKLTPNMEAMLASDSRDRTSGDSFFMIIIRYEDNVHGAHGYVVSLLTCLLTYSNAFGFRGPFRVLCLFSPIWSHLLVAVWAETNRIMYLVRVLNKPSWSQRNQMNSRITS